jgi:hypothetical protein
MLFRFFFICFCIYTKFIYYQIYIRDTSLRHGAAIYGILKDKLWCHIIHFLSFVNFIAAKFTLHLMYNKYNSSVSRSNARVII